MNHPGAARGHLALVHGERQDRTRGACAGLPGPVRLVLGGQEWVLALAAADTLPALRQPVRDLIRRTRADEPPACRGPRARIVRGGREVLDPRLGPAVVHHRGRQAILYCDSGQIRAQAAEALELLAARAASLARPGPGGIEVCVTRVPHQRLAALHPAVVILRDGQIEAHVCARQMTGTMAQALGRLLTAYAQELAAPGALRPASPA
jgi:rhodanese-related sulfurtransferase